MAEIQRHPESAARRRVWAGVDLGTQSARAVLVADDGTVLGAGARPLVSRRDEGGRHEQDPESWWEAVAGSLRQALAEAGPVEVGGLACCGTSGTILLAERTADDPARPLTPGLMYDDGRAVDEAERIAAAPSPAWSEAGLSIQRSWALPKALWLAARTGRDGRRVRLTHQVDLITSRLIGEPAAADTSNALKSGIEPVSATWPAADLESYGLDPALLPPLVRPGTVLGHVGAWAAEATGLPAGVPVVAGMTDGCAAQLAAGVLEPGRWNFVVGTTTVLKGVSDELLRDPSGALYSHRSPDGRWWPGGASSAGAGVLSGRFDAEDYPELEKLAAEREPAGCVTYPLVGTGERFPFRRPDAARLTLGEPRDDADLYASVLQGVAFVQRLCLDHVRHLGASVDGRVTVTGGAARSGYWMQLQADVLGREVAVPEVAEGALGMAVLAASTVDGLSAAAERMLGGVRVYSPRPDAGERFAEPYAALVGELAARGWIDDALARAALSGVST